MSVFIGLMLQGVLNINYDALGRVTGVGRTRGGAVVSSTQYTYDAADNRTGVTITNTPQGGAGGTGGGGATPPGSGGGDPGSSASGDGGFNIYVVPLKGMTVIFPS